MATATDDAIPQFPGSSTLSATHLVPVYTAGDPQKRLATFSDLRTELNDIAPGIDSVSETIAYTDFTDGGAAVGTYVMTVTVPVGAILLGSKVVVTAGFAGDTSAAMTIGDGSDVDRYNTSTINIFATAANGVESGVPSGNKLITTANTPTLTVTTAADFTSVSAGSITVTIYFLRTVNA